MQMCVYQNLSPECLWNNRGLTRDSVEEAVGPILSWSLVMGLGEVCVDFEVNTRVPQASETLY